MQIEKAQITVPVKEEAGEGWVSFESQRVTTGVTRPGEENKFNCMPVGYDATSARDKFGTSFGGDDDVSGGITPKSLEKGFERKDMKGTDDIYTGEHVDLFYGDAGGFAERNNYLDRN